VLRASSPVTSAGKIMPRNTQHLGLVQGLSHARNGKWRGSFDIHFEELNPAQTQLLMDRVHGGCRNRNSPSRGPGGCSGGIRSLQSLQSRRGFCDSLVNGDQVFRAVVMDQLLQTAVGPRIGVDTDHLAAFFNAGESQCRFTNSRSHVDDRIFGLGTIAPGKCTRASLSISALSISKRTNG
jgi:hypothetical protein